MSCSRRVVSSLVEASVVEQVEKYRSTVTSFGSHNSLHRETVPTRMILPPTMSATFLRDAAVSVIMRTNEGDLFISKIVESV